MLLHTHFLTHSTPMPQLRPSAAYTQLWRVMRFHLGLARSADVRWHGARCRAVKQLWQVQLGSCSLKVHEIHIQCSLSELSQASTTNRRLWPTTTKIVAVMAWGHWLTAYVRSSIGCMHACVRAREKERGIKGTEGVDFCSSQPHEVTDVKPEKA